MKKYKLLIISTLFIFNACHHAPHFTVEGTIAAAGGDTLYLEQVTDSAVKTLDYKLLSNDGDFTFKAEQPAFPEFYRLRIGTESILFAVDSCETIAINGQKKQICHQLHRNQLRQLRTHTTVAQFGFRPAKSRQYGTRQQHMEQRRNNRTDRATQNVSPTNNHGRHALDIGLLRYQSNG